MGIRLIVLGSGQDGGSPQFGTTRGVGRPRTASSIAVLDSDGLVLLFDATPDIRAQSLLLPTRESTEGPVDAVFITHAHMGHYAGLVHFGTEAAATPDIPLFAPDSVIAFLESNQPWAALFSNGYLDPIPMDESTATIGDIIVEAIPVPHRAEFSATCGFSISVEGEPWSLYLPDIDSWDAWPAAEEELARHRVCLIDASFSTAKELATRDIADIPHPLVPDTIARFAHLTPNTRIILTHMNHTNPAADPDSTIASHARAEGVEIAYDGMVVRHEARS